ncbi:MAG: ammonia-forming cytochrome c nitrite reductase subunit c552 [bacterium]|jgi:hypothetical protein
MFSLNRVNLCGGVGLVVLVATLVLGAMSVQAQTVVIRTRPLTPGEIKNAGLTNTTQLANGVANVGVGQPLYLEALVTKGQPVNNVSWSWINRPTNSVATFQTSPLLTNVVASFDGGDRLSYGIAARTLLVPDIACDPFITNNDFIVMVAVTLTNKTIYATNTCYGSLYIGCVAWTNNYSGPNGEGLCVLCHNAPNAGSKMDFWGQTAHATAFTRKINGEAGSGFKSTCVSCHVLGYDKTAGAVNGGFDDIATQVGWVYPTNLATAAATNNWNLMPLALKNKSNIQCESCHGPADRHARNLGDIKAIGISLSAGNCGHCHDSMTHHVKNYEWNQTLHATGTVFKGYATEASCAPCHSAQDFILVNDPDWAGVTNPVRLGTANEGITCVACHDPHSTGMGDYQLRSFTNVVLKNNAKLTLGGNGLLCMQCHKARQDAETYVLPALTPSGASRFGPHHGPQTDMLFGTNAIQYGMTMPSSRHVNVLEDSCIECHMQETPTNGVAMNKVGAHTFSLSYTTNSTTVDLTETCVKCHGEIEDFNIGGVDYDHDGVIEGTQTEIDGLVNTLALLLPPVGSATVTPSSAYTLSQRKALYNYLFVTEDRSHGVHNPKYAASILQASIDDLKGGIDVDRDGLLDSWEVANFGSFTAYNGSDDPDHDGVSNALEMAAGTNPNSSDSDGDGVSDLAELQGGSNPLSAGSKPTTNSVSLLPALELAYMPGTMGVTQQFQAVTALDITSTWTNIGPSFVSSNAWFYNLQSKRNATNKFYRVITVP